MLSKWAGNFAGKFLLVAAMGVIGLMVYWQHKLLTLEEQQKYIGKLLNLFSALYFLLIQVFMAL